MLAAQATGDVRVKVADPPGAKAVLEAAGLQVSSMGDAWAVHDVDDPARITRVLADAGHYVSELTPLDRRPRDPCSSTSPGSRHEHAD